MLQNQLSRCSLCPVVPSPGSVSNVREFVSCSVGQPFQGAYLEINKNPKYKKLKDAIEEKIIIAEVVNKINRANGKVKMLTLGACKKPSSVGVAIFCFLIRLLRFCILSRVPVKGALFPYL